MTLRFSVAPRTAKITIDGKLIEGTELALPRDDASHALRITAPGHTAHEAQLRLDENQRITVQLVRAAKSRPARPPGKPPKSIASIAKPIQKGPPCLFAAGMLVLSAAPAVAQKPGKQEQKEADRHFKSGVALFKESKYAEALAEFERAYEIAPHPLVLYNIAGCHRELSQYADAVKYYNRFLAEGKGKVPATRLTAAQSELDGILARIARVTVTVAPADGATIIVDGNQLGTLVAMPLMLPPGEHKIIARAAGHQDIERTIRVASGDELTIDLTLQELPPAPAKPPIAIVGPIGSAPASHARRFAVGAGFGTNLRRAADSGAPSLGLGVAIGSRLELGIDAVLVAYAVMPSIRVRLAGRALSVHAIGAVPIAFTDDEMSETFVAGAAGLGVRYRPIPALAFRLEALASFAGAAHGTTIPAFLGGELWF